MTGTLELRALKVWQHEQLLVNLRTTVRSGEILTVMGPSGSGKSTALMAVLGALPPAFHMEGQILLNDRDVTSLAPHQRRIGLLFQDDVLFPHLSVGTNLAFAIPPAVKGRAARHAKVQEALKQADLMGMADRDPATLSGGQRARIALMRALLAEPCALLLDEPFSRLDATLRTQIRSFVFQRLTDRKIPAILVTHDAEDALAAGGPVLSPLGTPVAL